MALGLGAAALVGDLDAVFFDVPAEGLAEEGAAWVLETFLAGALGAGLVALAGLVVETDFEVPLAGALFTAFWFALAGVAADLLVGFLAALFGDGAGFAAALEGAAFLATGLAVFDVPEFFGFAGIARDG